MFKVSFSFFLPSSSQLEPQAAINHGALDDSYTLHIGGSYMHQVHAPPPPANGSSIERALTTIGAAVAGKVLSQRSKDSSFTSTDTLMYQ